MMKGWDSMDSLLYHFGSLSGDHIGKEWNSFLNAARALRERLGTYAHLADRYIGFMLEAASQRTSEQVASDGFDAGGDLYGLCQSIVNGEDSRWDHPFFETASAYISGHPIVGISRVSSAWAYAGALFADYSQYAVEKYAREIEAEAQEITELETLAALRDQIIVALNGDEDGLFESMLMRYKECFSFASVQAVFLSGMLYEITEALTGRDKITGRQLIQLVFNLTPNVK